MMVVVNCAYSENDAIVGIAPFFCSSWVLEQGIRPGELKQLPLDVHAPLHGLAHVLEGQAEGALATRSIFDECDLVSFELLQAISQKTVVQDGGIFHCLRVEIPERECTEDVREDDCDLASRRLDAHTKLVCWKNLEN